MNTDDIRMDTLSVDGDQIEQLHDLIYSGDVEETYLSADKIRITTDRGGLLITANNGTIEVREDDER